METLDTLESAAGGQKPFKKREENISFPDRAFYRDVRIFFRKKCRKNVVMKGLQLQTERWFLIS